MTRFVKPDSPEHPGPLLAVRLGVVILAIVNVMAITFALAYESQTPLMLAGALDGLALALTLLMWLSAGQVRHDRSAQ